MAGEKFERNRMHNSNNPSQGDFKRVLCVCSAGLLRSPTAAKVLGGDPFNFNTRAAGCEESFALVPVDKVLLFWADEVVCMTKDHMTILTQKYGDALNGKPIVVLDIPDDFDFMDPVLVRLIKDRYIESQQPGHKPVEHDVNCASIMYESRTCDCQKA